MIKVKEKVMEVGPMHHTPMGILSRSDPSFNIIADKLIEVVQKYNGMKVYKHEVVKETEVVGAVYYLREFGSVGYKEVDINTKGAVEYSVFKEHYYLIVLLQ